MKTMDDLNQLLCQQAPSDPLVKLLNETFGPLGWEYEDGLLKANVKVSDGHFFSVTRGAADLATAARLFGLEVKNAQSNEGQRKVDASAPPTNEAGALNTWVGSPSNPVGPSSGESQPAVPTGAPKPSRKVILDSISECSRIILAKKLRTQDQLVKMVEAFAVKRKEELNYEEALKLLEQLKEILQ